LSYLFFFYFHRDKFMVIELSCQDLSPIGNEDHLLLHEVDSLTAEIVCLC